MAIDHPAYPAKDARWNVMVEAGGVIGCTGSFRWRWLARIRAHRDRRYWPGPKDVRIEWRPPRVPRPRSTARRVNSADGSSFYEVCFADRDAE